MGKERSELPWGPAGGPELSELCQCPFSLPRAGRGFSGQRSGWVTMRIQALLPPGCGSTPWYPPPRCLLVSSALPPPILLWEPSSGALPRIPLLFPPSVGSGTGSARVTAVPSAGLPVRNP